MSENILKHDNTLLAQRQVDNLDLPNESKKFLKGKLFVETNGFLSIGAFQN